MSLFFRYFCSVSRFKQFQFVQPLVWAVDTIALNFSTELDSTDGSMQVLERLDF